MVELTLPNDAGIHAKEYQLDLPSKGNLQKRLMEKGGGTSLNLFTLVLLQGKWAGQTLKLETVLNEMG